MDDARSGVPGGEGRACGRTDVNVNLNAASWLHEVSSQETRRGFGRSSRRFSLYGEPRIRATEQLLCRWPKVSIPALDIGSDGRFAAPNRAHETGGSTAMRSEIADGIATLSFTSPATFNALDGAKTKQFRDALDRALDDPGVRVVILRGDGPAFGAGGDLAMFEPMAQAPEILRSLGRDLNAGIERLRTTDAVVLAAVHGSVAGGSIGLMLAADMAIAAEGTRFNFAYMKIGGCPDAGNSVFLPRIVGDRKAFELIALSETFDAAEALRLGLVNRVVPLDRLDAETRKLAARFAAGPAASFAATKHLLRQSATAPLRQHLDREIETFARVSSTPDFVEGVTAFRTKRAPKFGQG